MAPVTVEVDIDHGRLVVKQPHLLPETGTGVLTILPLEAGTVPPRNRVNLPLVRCVPGTLLNPTPEDSMKASGIARDALGGRCPP